MKAATGELNLTVITIIAIGVIAAFFAIFWESTIKPAIEGGWGESTGYVETVNNILL